MNSYPRMPEPPARPADMPVHLWGQTIVVFILAHGVATVFDSEDLEIARHVMTGIVGGQWSDTVRARLIRCQGIITSTLRARDRRPEPVQDAPRAPQAERPDDRPDRGHTAPLRPRPDGYPPADGRIIPERRPVLAGPDDDAFPF